MNRICLALARLASAMWVGAAVLFVVTSITEQIHPSIDVATKDTLALIRFPWYYGMGATLLAISAVASGCLARRDRWYAIAATLLAAALLLMAIDYVSIYMPLQEVMRSPETSRGDSFQRLHTWSEWINSAGLMLATAGAILLCATNRVSK